MEHTTFDLVEWHRRLAPSIRTDVRLGACDSPAAMLQLDQIRDRASRVGDLGPRAPVDVFAFGKGEPRARQLTKVNGLPYRPADRPWPFDSDGRPMTFLMQFCFADSRDLLPNLPGDVLVVFARLHRGYLVDREGLDLEPDEGSSGLVFEWYPLGLSNLIPASEIPKPPPIPPREFQVKSYDDQGRLLPARPFVFPTCFGMRHRTWDYVDEERVVRFGRQVSPPLPDDVEDEPEYASAIWRQLACFPGTKVGGLPYWYNPPGPEVNGRFIAAFGGVSLLSELPYPWTNMREPMSEAECRADENRLELRGGCSLLNFFLRDDGEVEYYLDTDKPW